MMKQKTVENCVLEILEECPRTRYDDMILFYEYYERYGEIPAGNFPLYDLAYNYKGYGLPCFETIRRARQRVQSLFPYLSRTYGANENNGITVIININEGSR